MKKYIKPSVSNLFRSRNMVPLAVASLSVGQAFAVGAAVGLGMRDIYTPAISGINNQR